MNDMILVLNFSNEFAMEIARRLRVERVYSRVMSGMTTAAQIREVAPKGIILAGEAKSAVGVMDAGILELGIPVLALGHASHMLLAAQGGACAGVALSGRKAAVCCEESALLRNLYGGERYIEEALVLMLPPDVRMIASAGGCTIAFEKTGAQQFGVQYEIERNDPDATTMLMNFARDICGCTPWWTTEAAIAQANGVLEKAAQGSGRAVCAVSGGVDSTVAALLAHKAFGDRLTAVFMDTGLLREQEKDNAIALFEKLGIPLLCVDRADAVLDALANKTERQEKNSVVARCLYDEVERQSASMPDMAYFIRGMNYSDFLHKRYSDEDNYTLEVIDPIGMLFKDEVRDAALLLGLPEELAQRKPFPALGLGDRIVGEVSRERLSMMRTAERIFDEEIREAGLDRRLYKYFPVLAGTMTRTGGEMIVLRAVTRTSGMLYPARLPYDLIERVTQRILEAEPGTSRVFFDYTPTRLDNESFA
ncbi:MAG: phosphoadenosine phosphosulfate reductase family protein [Clostridia bacterium]|nr:phosphoadenosine phosphosulfate reductase family protein [Clostridia bacterium]